MNFPSALHANIRGFCLGSTTRYRVTGRIKIGRKRVRSFLISNTCALHNFLIRSVLDNPGKWKHERSTSWKKRKRKMREAALFLERGVHGIYEVKPCHCESKKRWTAVTRGMEINPVSRAIGIWWIDGSFASFASLPLSYFPFPLTTYRHLFDKFSDIVIRWNPSNNHLIGIQHICNTTDCMEFQKHILEYYFIYSFFRCVEYKWKRN